MTADRLLTPSKITAWLDCAHVLTLKSRVEDGVMSEPNAPFGSFAKLLAEKGLQHEADCLADYERRGKKILRIPDRDRERGESFAAWVARVGNPFSKGWDVIYQMPFIHDGIRGIADFLVRVEDPDSGVVSYEPVDAKLVRVDAKPGHVLQLCFYADAIEALSGIRPRQMHIWLGSGSVETLVVAEFRPYWNRLRTQLSRVLAEYPAQTPSVPEPCPHCEFCEFFEHCSQEWRNDDALHFVAGIRGPDRARLQDGGVTKLGELAAYRGVVEGLQPERLARLVDQATLQLVTRLQSEGEPPAYRMIEVTNDPVWGHGFEELPQPDDADVFLDFEGHPFWRADTDLFFLFGLIERDAEGAWSYRTWWAHSPEEEAAATKLLIDFLDERRRAHPRMHVYHYNHTERSSLVRLTMEHSVAEVALSRMLEDGLFVDLLIVARNAMQVGTESYGLKSLERLTTFERGHDIDQGAGAVIEYEKYMADRDLQALDRIAAYNRDDVLATLALRDWLIDHRPADALWRAAVLEPPPGVPELDEQVTLLHGFEPGSPEHLLGDLLGYWTEEGLADFAPKWAKLEADPTTLFEDREVLTGLTPIDLVQRFGKKGQPLDDPAMRFAMPRQVTGAFKSAEDAVLYRTAENKAGYATVHRLDPEAGEVELVWNIKSQELGVEPTVVVLNDWINPEPKPAALSSFASQVLDQSGPRPNPVTLALLRRERPVFAAGGGPPDGIFSDDFDEMIGWATQLDHSYVAIQGPPGTGKTYRGAHLVRTLIAAGKRIGIAAMSHQAIDNLLSEIVKELTDTGDLELLRAVRKPGDDTKRIDGITYTRDNKRCARGDFNVVAGTTWLFASEAMRDAPVDVLLVDEAGQLSLADALASSLSAQNLVLLGDPLQLPQVAKALHPGGGGVSALEHVLGSDATIAADRGVFLTETRRMHPDVCSYISDEIYEGRLLSHPITRQQSTAAGTGLRWIQAHHDGNSTQSTEEADIVADQVAQLIDTEWTNQKGENLPLTVENIMVVAPYNDHVRLLRARLDSNERTHGVKAGTVDRFQGGEAAVVFYTMATSTSADMTRGADFLFSRNRLNVAVSRARCLAYLVCTEALLDTRARNLDEMRLLSTLSAFVERAIPSD